jgi:hypothetical protein
VANDSTIRARYCAIEKFSLNINLLKINFIHYLYRSSLFLVRKMISPRNPARNNCVPKTIVVKAMKTKDYSLPNCSAYHYTCGIIWNTYITSKHKSYNEHQGSHGKGCIGLSKRERNQMVIKSENRLQNVPFKFSFTIFSGLMLHYFSNFQNQHS